MIRTSPPPALPTVPIVDMPKAAKVPSAPPPPSSRGPSSLPPTGGDALGLVDRVHTTAPRLDLATEMKDRFALGDFTGSLRASELLLGRDPNNAEAGRFASMSRERLIHLYSSKLGDLGRVPELAVQENDVRWLGLDHRSGFVMSRIDGRTTVDELVDITGMSRLEVFKTLVELLDAGTVRLK